MSDKFFAVVNPAAGGGHCRKLVAPVLDRLRASGIKLEAVETDAPGQGSGLTRDAYARGYRKFIAVAPGAPDAPAARRQLKEMESLMPKKAASETAPAKSDEPAAAAPAAEQTP